MCVCVVNLNFRFTFSFFFIIFVVVRTEGGTTCLQKIERKENNRPRMGEYDHSIRDFNFIIGRFDIFNLSNKKYDDKNTDIQQNSTHVVRQ